MRRSTSLVTPAVDEAAGIAGVEDVRDHMRQSVGIVMPALDEAAGIAGAEDAKDCVRQSVSIVMPALDEAASIAGVVSSIPVKRFADLGFDAEIIVVDNGSVDNTGELARNAGARVVREPRRGYGNAYLRGFAEARGDVICTLDADGTYPASDLPRLVEQLLEQDLDFISTDRFALMTNGVMRRTNKLGNAVLNVVGRAFFRLPFRDSQSGMWVFRADLLQRMRLQSPSMALSQEIKIEAACRLKARCAEYPIKYGYRSGCPKLRPWRDGLGNLLHLMRKRLDRQH